MVQNKDTTMKERMNALSLLMQRMHDSPPLRVDCWTRIIFDLIKNKVACFICGLE
jgi:hypothetical protein